MRILRQLLLLALVPVFATAATHRVPSDYTDIQSAIDASVSGDTVMVAPKLYDCHLDFTGKDIVLISEAGPDLTILRLDTYLAPLVLFENGETNSARVQGFSMIGTYYWGPAVRIIEASPTISGNKVIMHRSRTSGGHPQVYISNSASSPIIEDNLFINDDSSGGIIAILNNGYTKVINNTIVGGTHGVYNWSTNTLVRNNIITNCAVGIYAVNHTDEDHNCLWGNVLDYQSVIPDPNDIFADPLFIDTGSWNFQLSNASPCINMGHTDAQYDDPDGTTGDIGTYYFDRRVPYPYNLNLGTDDFTHLTNHSPTFYWSFYGIEQEGFEIEIGTDKDWSIAETWQTGFVVSVDTSYIYAGPSLLDSMTYYYRIRTFDSANIGPWNEAVFRMNAPSFAPAQIFPIDGDSTSVLGVELYVQNAYDPENDDLTYDYEVYADAGMSSLIASVTDIIEQNDSTSSGKITGLLSGNSYYWRCRAYDDLEYSEWSSLRQMYVRDPEVYNVPSVFPTIQAAIDVAREGDTVLVADGDYSGIGNYELNFRGINIILKSENGHESTTITSLGLPDTGPSQMLFRFVTGEDTTSIIDGFTIGNGGAGYWAIFVDTAAVTVKNCKLTNTDGSGLYGTAASLVHIDSSVFCYLGADGAALFGRGRVTNSLFYRNAYNGLGIDYMSVVDVLNCTFALNESSGFYVNPEPPKQADQTNQTSTAYDSASISYCLSAFNGGVGFLNWGWTHSWVDKCNNAYGNDYSQFPDYVTIGENGNVSENPLFCDTAANNFQISESSICAPANNDCGLLIGALGVGCTGCCMYRGDFNHSGGEIPVDISDITAFVDYLFAGGSAPVCPEEGDINNSGQIDITDLTFLVDFIFNGGASPPPC